MPNTCCLDSTKAEELLFFNESIQLIHALEICRSVISRLNSQRGVIEEMLTDLILNDILG